MSLGGVLGGLFNSLLAPWFFSSVVEYPLMLVAACLIRPADRGLAKRTDFNRRDLVSILILAALTAAILGVVIGLDIPQNALTIALVYGVPAVAAFGFKERPIRFALGVAVVTLAVSIYSNSESGQVLLARRNYFGVIRVRTDPERRFHVFEHGTTIHGIQEWSPDPVHAPLGYYGTHGPLGEIFNSANAARPLRRVAVTGLGVGGIAAFGEPNQSFTFYEIDPAVYEVARDARYFTFLRDCQADLRVVVGDARLELAKEPDGNFDLMILDAFSSDAIPSHLLTAEAFDLYLRKLSPAGMLACHISSRYLNVEPVLARQAADAGLVALSRRFAATPQDQEQGLYSSHFVVMGRNSTHLGGLAQDGDWKSLSADPGIRPWTDDFTNILSVINW
jgi:hypothetical protein